MGKIQGPSSAGTVTLFEPASNSKASGLSLLQGDDNELIQTIIQDRGLQDERSKPRQLRKMLTAMNDIRPGTIKHNELTDEIIIGDIPLLPREFEVVHHRLDERLGVMASRQAAQDALKFVAHKNSYHPVKQYLEMVANDSTIKSIELEEVATRVLGVTDELSGAMVRCWLCGAASKALEERGSRFIEVLTLIHSRQGIGKSEFIRSLAGDPDWYSDSFAHADKDTDRILGLHHAWINEISEVDQVATSKRSFSQLKSLISTTSDLLRRPYGSTVESLPRRFVIGATSNTDDLFHTSDEQRRFWPIVVNPTTDDDRLDIKWLRANRDRIWATATRLYRQLGEEAFTLSTEQRAEVIRRNANEFSQVPLIADRVASFLEKEDIRSITTDEVLRYVLGLERSNRADEMNVAAVMKGEGYEKKRNVKKNGRLCSSVWVKDSRSVDFVDSAAVVEF